MCIRDSLINDKNGYHSQKGFRVAYAHHIMFSRDVVDLNQLSFGVNVGFAPVSYTHLDVYKRQPLICLVLYRHRYLQVILLSFT